MSPPLTKDLVLQILKFFHLLSLLLARLPILRSIYSNLLTCVCLSTVLSVVPVRICTTFYTVPLFARDLAVARLFSLTFPFPPPL